MNNDFSILYHPILRTVLINILMPEAPQWVHKRFLLTPPFSTLHVCYEVDTDIGKGILPGKLGVNST